MSTNGGILAGKPARMLGRVNPGHILLLAFVLRIVFFLTVFEAYSGKYGWERDDNYDEIALNVLDGNGYRIDPDLPPNTVRPPLYTLFLMFVFSLFGHARWKVVVAQALLQTLVCYLVYRLGKRFTGDSNTAKLAALLYAVYPQSMLYTSMYMTESLFALLIILSAWVYFDVAAGDSGPKSLLLGILLGLSALTRPIAMLLFVPVCVLYLWRGRHRTVERSRLFRNAVLVVLSFVLTITPWTLRNYAMTGKIIPVSSRGGHFLYSNTIADAEEERTDQIEAFGEADNSDPEGRDATYLSMALSNILEKPHLFLANTVRTMLDFWHRGHSRAISVFNGITNFFLLFLAVLGVVKYGRRTGVLLTVLVVYVLYFNLCYGLLHAISRYSFPVIPFVLIYAAYSVTVIPGGSSHADS